MKKFQEWSETRNPRTLPPGYVTDCNCSDADTVGHILFECQYWSGLREDLGALLGQPQPWWTCHPFFTALPSRTLQWRGELH